MKIELAAPVIRGGREDARDIRQVKRVLVCTGFYVPDPATGVSGDAEPRFWMALHAFQRAHMIPFTDTAGPGSVTETVMNEELVALEEGGGSYIWRTAGDAKVRPEHAARDGRQYRWDDPPDGENPAEDYNCRCWAEPLSPSRHPLAEDARAAQVEITSGAMGMPIPQPPMPSEWQEVGANAVAWNGLKISVFACWGNSACRAWMIRKGMEIVLESSHHLPPKNLPAFPDAKPSRRKGGRKRWIDSNGKIYEWDSQHGEIEVYDKIGKKHLGGFDHQTGKQRSKPVPGRKIEK